MAQFTVARVEDVVPKKKPRQPSQRAQTQEQYQEALRRALSITGQALVVELTPDEKPLTVRNRIKRAADVLGYEDIAIRRRKDRIVAYLPDSDSSQS
ncbi:MAG: hypothetical protein ACR2GA_01890 [Chloroflexota bacterium]